MTRLDTLFFDVGGVRLTNGWDTQIFSAFFSSCDPGVRKPDTRIYKIALEGMQADREASLFVDDREENVAGAEAVGLRALHAPEPGRLVEYLRDAGVEI